MNGNLSLIRIWQQNVNKSAISQQDLLSKAMNTHLFTAHNIRPRTPLDALPPPSRFFPRFDLHGEGRIVRFALFFWCLGDIVHCPS